MIADRGTGHHPSVPPTLRTWKGQTVLCSPVRSGVSLDWPVCRTRNCAKPLPVAPRCVHRPSWPRPSGRRRVSNYRGCFWNRVRIRKYGSHSGLPCGINDSAIVTYPVGSANCQGTIGCISILGQLVLQCSQSPSSGTSRPGQDMPQTPPRGFERCSKLPPN